MRRTILSLLAIASLGLALTAGCSNDDPVTAPPPPGVLVADSPENAVRLMAAAWEARDTVAYHGLFTSDYVFDITPADTVGTGMPDSDLIWSEEMRFASRCFRTGTLQLFPAHSIQFVLDSSLVSVPDTRPGKDAGWHKRMDSMTHVTVDAIDTVFEVFQGVRFYATRGDSALVTAEIRGSGGLADASRWYIDRIEPSVVVASWSRPASRRTVASPAALGGARARSTLAPSGGTTLGRLKLAYLAP